MLGGTINGFPNKVSNPKRKKPTEIQVSGQAQKKQKQKITNKKGVGAGEEKPGVFKSKRGKRCIDWQHEIQTGPRSVG